METNLYFIAIAPDADLSEKIRAISKDFATRFGSVKAYENFPHITLIPPFKLPQDKEGVLQHNFSHIRLSTPAFELELNGFKAFQNKKSPVIYIHPENSELVRKLFKELEVFFDFNPYKNFHPHLTVAYRDLTPEQFALAWQEYEHSPFRERFTVNNVYLYKFLKGRWKLLEALGLPQRED